MGIVRFALRFPYTFYGLSALILFLGISAIRVMPIDIFPEINIPVVNVIWQYTGLSTPEMEQRVSTYSQYAISTSVSGIKNMEAQTLNGISVQKIFFQPDVNIDLAVAQIVSATNYIRVLLPTGIYAPIVVSYNASSIPVLQLSLASDNLNEQKLYDYGYYNLRQQLAPVPGVTFPTPDGGKYRQIMVDIDPTKLQAKGLTPTDVVNAVNAESLTLPSGLAKIGDDAQQDRALAVLADDILLYCRRLYIVERLDCRGHRIGGRAGPRCAWSNNSLMASPGGAAARAVCRTFRTPFTTASVEALPFRRSPPRGPRSRPSRRRASSRRLRRRADTVA
jgi:multidrug efflux pump subunit AcrB